MSEIDVRFDYHPPTKAQQDRMAELRRKFKNLAIDIATDTPESREQSLALTALEQAQFYVNAAIARRERE